MTTTVEPQERVRTNEFTVFGREIAELLVEAINQHGVRFRRMDATHARLYCGNREVMPFKVSRSRPPEETLPNLRKWLSRNVPTWDTRNEKPKPNPNELADAFVDAVTAGNDTARQNGRDLGKALTMTTTTAPTLPITEPKPKPTTTQPAATIWKAWRNDAGQSWGFETNGKTWRCTHKDCGYTQDTPRGLHLHYYRHTGDADRMHAKASEVRRRRNEEKRQQTEKDQMLVTQAVTILAAAHGMSVSTEDVSALTAELAGVKARLAEVTRERDDAKARLEIIQEAMRA